ncbi:MAG: ABC transporter substrate-binding protein [Acidimicrobiia bacterium]|nr:ABC transporter substrate-binding protein [Acidimicrobiia bacterium]
MRRGLWVGLAVLALVAAACSNSESDGGNEQGGEDGGGEQTAVDQPGVSDSEIAVGVVASTTNPIGGNYGTIADGIRAYFEKVNSEGGVYDRDMVIGSERDDQLANNQAEVQALLTQDDVFAAFVATLSFTGADLLAESGTPTFGWNINPEFSGPENFFGERGSSLCFGCPDPLLPFVAQELGVDKVGTLAYNVPQSAECADGVVASFEEWPTAEVAFVDTSLQYGTTDYSADVTRMKNEGVELVEPCMDFNGVNALLQEMRRQDYEPTMYLPNSYNHDFIAEYADLYEGSIVLTAFAPFETEDPPQGLEDFLTWMDNIGAAPTEPAVAGWVGAQQLVNAIDATGPDFTQQKVIDWINQSDEFTADGLLSGILWPDQHDELNPNDDCDALSEVVDGGFRPHPDFTEPGKPFMCFPREMDELEEPTFR